MKNISILKFGLTLLIVVLLIISCDKRKDYFYQYNKAPEFSIKKSGLGGNYTAYLTDSVWNNGAGYVLEYKNIDEANDVETYSFVVNIGTGSVLFNEATKQITISGLSLGKNNINLIATDKYGVESKVTVELFVINNRSPFAGLTVIQTNFNSAREINISSVPNSGDVDIKFGDFIQEYQFRVGPTYTVNTPYNNINFIAASTGTVMVYLRVKDSMGALSNRDSLKVNIN